MGKRIKATALLLVFSIISIIFPDGFIHINSSLAAASYSTISHETEQAFIERLKSAVENFTELVTISDLKIPKTYDFNDIFYKFLKDYPEYFYLSSNYSASFKSNYFTYFGLNFTNEIDEIVPMREDFNRATEEALSGIDSSWPDVMKALYLHDYIILNAEYDTDFDEWNTDFDDMCYTAYGILVDKKGVCQGYSYAYSCLLNAVGIENELVSSEDMCHVWNLVKIDGSYYHVDLTFDDTEYNNIGRAKHSNFMLSDSKIVNASGTKHYVWEDSTAIRANSTKYDDFFWRNIESGFFPIDNMWYFTDKKGNINSYDPKTNGIKTLMNVDVNWKRWGYTSEYLNDKYVRLLALSDKIIYNTDSEIYMTDTNAIKPEKIFEADVTSGYIYGIGVENNNVTYCLKKRSGEIEKVYNTDISVDSLDINVSNLKPIVKTVNYYGYGDILIQTQQLTDTDEVVPPVMEDVNGYRFVHWSSTESKNEINFYAVYKLIGDMDNDNKLTLLDAYYVYCLSQKTISITTDIYKLADIDNDGTVNQSDCKLILQNLTR